MILWGFIDLDDTIFPTSFMNKFFDKKKGVFNPPQPVKDSLCRLDITIYNFISRHMGYCRFRILTRATQNWVRQALSFYPNLQRLVDWHYVSVVICKNMTKQEKVYELMSRSKLVDMYFCCGDSQEDVTVYTIRICETENVGQHKDDFIYSVSYIVRHRI